MNLIIQVKSHLYANHLCWSDALESNIYFLLLYLFNDYIYISAHKYVRYVYLESIGVTIRSRSTANMDLALRVDYLLTIFVARF